MRKPIPFGKYLLLERISVGGMAEVFTAKSFGVQGFEKLLAIKRILPSMGEDEDFIKMFVDEAKIAGQLNHSNIGQIHELGKVDDQHFIAMEYIWGRDLLQVKNRYRSLKERISPPMASYIIMKICEGLDYAHKKRDVLGVPLKIVHRDCSPQNILISFEGEVKLIDFGIAKAASQSARTSAGVLKGKFGYMSPEQVRGLPLDGRSDIFALGTILYEIVTASRLFLGESDFSTLDKVRNAEVNRPRLEASNVPKEVSAIILKALSRSVEDRFQSCGEMRDALQQYLQKQERIYAARDLADELGRIFAKEIRLERERNDAYMRIGRLDSTPIHKPAPKVDVLVTSQGPPPQSDFEDLPTEVFGELSGANRLSSALEDLAEPGNQESIQVELSASTSGNEALLETETAQPKSEARATIQPVHPPTQSVPALSATMPIMAAPRLHDFPIRHQALPIRPHASQKFFIAAGLLVALVLVLGTVWSLRQTDTQSDTTATLLVLVNDSNPAELWIAGHKRASMSGGEPFVVEGLAGGEHEIEVRRPGVGACLRPLVLEPGKTRIFRCAFASRAQNVSPANDAGPLIAAESLPVDAAGFHDAQVPTNKTTVAKKQPEQSKIAKSPSPSLAKRRQGAKKPVRNVAPSTPVRPPAKDHSEPPVAAAPDPPSPRQQTHGYFTAFTQPWARVLIDGKDTGKITPITRTSKIKLEAGHHTVTFVTTTKRFQFPIEIRPGQVVRLAKILK